MPLILERNEVDIADQIEWWHLIKKFKSAGDGLPTALSEQIWQVGFWSHFLFYIYPINTVLNM